MSFIPLSTPDPSRCYGHEDCEECKGLCSGHFLKLGNLWEHVSKGGKMLSEPPSRVLLKEFNRHRVIPNDGRLKEIAKEVLLSVDETKMWFEHLSSVHKNRKKGSQKAARARSSSSLRNS